MISDEQLKSWKELCEKAPEILSFYQYVPKTDSDEQAIKFYGKTKIIIPALIAEVEKLKQALKATQWGFNHRRCSVCAGWNMSENGETDFKHTNDCIVGQALAEWKEAK